MTSISEHELESMKCTLRNVSPQIAEDFEEYYMNSIYSATVLYNLYMSHGSEANALIEEGIKNNLSGAALEFISDRKMEIEYDKRTEWLKTNPFETKQEHNEKKLPKKLRRGW